MNSVTVRVPATTANLACGFDTLGCALSLYNTLSFTLSDSLSFTGCDEEFQTPDNLACQGFDAVYTRLGRPAYRHPRRYPRLPRPRLLRRDDRFRCNGGKRSLRCRAFKGRASIDHHPH